MKIPEGWKLVPVDPTAEMLCEAELAYNGSHRDAYRAMLAVAPTPPAQAAGLPAEVLHALRFYANGEHFSIDADHHEFDTVSGEPDNWLHSQRDEDCTMIEDGGIARAVLQGKKIHGDMDSQPVEGEVFGAPPAQEDEPVGYTSRYGLSLIRQRGENSTTISVTGRKYGAYSTPLYTRPDNSRLRKAAEEALHWLEYLNAKSTQNHTQVERARHAEKNLRAELNKGEA